MPDGSYELEVPYGEDWELIQDILKQGSDIEVLAPEQLRVKVKETIKKMTALYWVFGTYVRVRGVALTRLHLLTIFVHKRVLFAVNPTSHTDVYL